MKMIIRTMNTIINESDNNNVSIRAVVDKCQINETLALSAAGVFKLLN